MKRLTILIDADDVLDDLLPAWVAVLNRISGQSLTPEDIDSWHIPQFYPTLPVETVYAVPTQPEFWSTVDAVPGAVDGLRSLLDAGHQVRIVTASHYSTLSFKIPRLLELFPYLSWDDFIITSSKELVRGDIIVDDNPTNMTDPNKFNILYDRPHNRNYTSPSVFRARNWEEVLWEIKVYEFLHR